MFPKTPLGPKEVAQVKRRWHYDFQPTHVKQPLIPYSNQEMLRRRAERLAREALAAQPQTFMDPGLNPAVAARMRQEYGLPDDTALRYAGQTIGAGIGLSLTYGNVVSMGKSGAAVGSMVKPGIGTVAGAIVGGVAGLASTVGAMYTGAAAVGATSPSGLAASYQMTRDIIRNAISNPVGGSIQGVSTVGATMGQFKGVPVLRSAILALQNDGDLIENLNRAYGMHEDGYSRIDFARIRKNANVDLPFGNGLIDWVGEMALDPIMWKNSALRRIEAAVADGAMVVMATESIEDPLLQALEPHTMKRIGNIALDSLTDRHEALEQFKNLMRTNDDTRALILEQAKQYFGESNGETFHKQAEVLFEKYSNLILQSITRQDMEIFSQVSANVELTQQQLEQIQLLNPKVTGYESFSKNIQQHFRRHGFKFTPLDMQMLQNEYPTLRKHVDMQNEVNKWLMRITNPTYTAGTEGSKKLMEIIRSGDAREFLLNHYARFNQGREPFIDIKDQDGLISIAPTKKHREELKNFKESINELNFEREEAYNVLRNLTKNDEELQNLYEELGDVNTKISRERSRLNAEIKRRHKELNVYDGDVKINDNLIEVYKKRLKNMKEQGNESNSNFKETVEKYTTAINMHNQIQNYLAIETSLMNYYVDVQSTLDKIQTVHSRFERLYNSEKATAHDPSFPSLKAWLLGNEGYRDNIAFLEEYYDDAMAVLEERVKGAVIFDPDHPVGKKRDMLKNHPALKHLPKFRANFERNYKENDFYNSMQEAIDERLKEANLHESEYLNEVLLEKDERQDVFDNMLKHVYNESDKNFDMELRALDIDPTLIKREQRVDYDPYRSENLRTVLKDAIEETRDLEELQVPEHLEHILELDDEGMDDLFIRYERSIARITNEVRTLAPWMDEEREYDFDEIDEHIFKPFGLSLEDIVAKRADYKRAELSALPVYIDGQMVNIESFKDAPVPALAALIENYFPEYGPIYKGILEKGKMPYYQVQELMRLFDTVANQMGHLQVNKNTVSVQQYLDPIVHSTINEMYLAFTDSRLTQGPYKLFAEFVESIEEDPFKYRKFHDLKETILNTKHSADLLSKVSYVHQEEFMKTYPDNTFVGAFFDMVSTINNSRLMEPGYYTQFENKKNNEVLYNKITERVADMRKLFREKEYPEELINTVIDDLYDRLLLSNDSIYHMRDYSPYATGVYFTELNKRKIDQIYTGFKSVYDGLERQTREEQIGQRMRVRASKYTGDIDTDAFSFNSFVEKIEQAHGKAQTPTLQASNDVEIRKAWIDEIVRNVQGEVPAQSLARTDRTLINRFKTIKKEWRRRYEETKQSIEGFDKTFQEYIDSNPEAKRQLEVYGKMAQKVSNPELKKAIDLVSQRLGIENLSTDQLEMIMEMFTEKNVSRVGKSLGIVKNEEDLKLMRVLERFISGRTIDKLHEEMAGTTGAVDFDTGMYSGRPPGVAQFKEHLEGFTEAARGPLRFAKYTNQNLKGHLFSTEGTQEQININKPFNPAELVKNNAPYVFRQPEHVKFNAGQKRLLRTFKDADDSPFKHDLTMRDYISQKVPVPENREKIEDAIFAAFDVEALSLDYNPRGLDIVQIGAYDEKGESYEAYIAGQVVSDMFTQITGITQKTVDEKGKPANQVFKEFFEFAKDKNLIAHNLPYDLKRVQGELEARGMDLTKTPIDTLDLARKLYGLEREQLENNTLTSVFSFLEERIKNQMLEENRFANEEMLENYLNTLKDGAHSALSDAEMTLLVAREMIKDLKAKDINYIDEIMTDRGLQLTARARMLGQNISGSYTETGEEYQASILEANDILERAKNTWGWGEEEVKLLRMAASEEADQIMGGMNFNEFDKPSLMDQEFFNATKALVKEQDQVFEFMKHTQDLKKRGFNSSQGNYMLMYYNDVFRGQEGTEESIHEFYEIARKHGDYTEDDIRKAFANYQYKRFELPEPIMDGEVELSKKDIAEVKKRARIGLQQNHKDYAKVLRHHRDKKAEVDKLIEERGTYKTNNRKVNSNIFFLVSSVEEGDMVDYLQEMIGEGVEVDFKALAEEVLDYQKTHKGSVDWTHPLINKLKAYSGEPGEWEVMTPDQQRLKRLQSNLEQILRKDGDQEVSELRRELEELTRQEIFKGKDTKRAQRRVIKKLETSYGFKAGDLEQAQEMLKEINELRMKTHGQKAPEFIKGERAPKLPDGMVAEFKQEYQAGTAIKEFIEERELIKKRIEQRKEELAQSREKLFGDLKKKYGHWNEVEASEQARDLTELLIAGDYEGFANRYSELLPEGDAQEKIKKFQEFIERRGQGKRFYKRKGERVQTLSEKGIVGFKEGTKEKYLRDHDDVFDYLSGKERYENWMRTEAEAFITEFELELGFDQKTREWVPGERHLEFPWHESPRVERLNRLENMYQFDLADIQQTFRNSAELEQFLKTHKEYRLVATTLDNTEASKGLSKFYIDKDGEAQLKDYHLARLPKDPEKRANKLAQLEDEKARFLAGEYDKDKPAIKEILYGDTTDLDKLFNPRGYDIDETSIGIMSIEHLKQAREISYKPFELPGPLDWYFRNILRVQKQDILINSSWHATNIIDMARKNSQMMDGIWQTRDYIEKLSDANQYYGSWQTYRQDMVNHLKEIEGDREALAEWGSKSFKQYIRERGHGEDITSLAEIDMDNEQNLITQMFLKWEKSKQFQNLSEEKKVAFLNERKEDALNILNEVNEFQMTSATTDMPEYLMRMEANVLGESSEFHRKVFRYMASENPIMRTNMKIASNLEQRGRLHGYLLDKYLHGTTQDRALLNSLQRHFDYSDRSLPELYGTLMFPFIAFPTRNALFWQKQLQDAALNRRFYHMLNAAWGRFDVEQNEYAQAMRSKGFIPIGNTLVKVGDSRAAALEMGSNPGNVAMSRLNPLLRAPLQILKGDSERSAGRQIADAIPFVRRIPQVADNISAMREGGVKKQNVFPSIFGTIHDDSSYSNPVFRRQRNVYNQLFNKQGRYRQLSNNAYYRTRQIMNESQRRRAL